MAWKQLSEEQWEAVSGHLPAPVPGPKGGRPRADNRLCFEGILWILWTGALWRELPLAGTPFDGNSLYVMVSRARRIADFASGQRTGLCFVYGGLS